MLARLMPRLGLLATLLVVLGLAASPAHADSLGDAEAFAAAGDTENARLALATWLEETAQPSPAALLRAAQLARALPDLDLLGAVRAAAETLEQERAASPTLDLALGYAYLGLAEENLRLNTQSRSVSLYFADALTRASAVPADAAEGEDAARLAAGVRYAQGDLAGAVDGLTAHRDAVPEVSTRFEALAGRLLYEVGASQSSADGEATLLAAVDALTIATEADDLPEVMRRSSRLRLAWARHRLGDTEEADEAYRQTYAADTKEAPLVLRGLASLHAYNPGALAEALEAIAGDAPPTLAFLDVLAEAYLRAGRVADAFATATRRLDAAPEDPDGWFRLGLASSALGLHARALDQWAEALQRKSDHLPASGAIEATAQQWVASDPERGIAVYERLLALRPGDPYVRNNYGFILRDLVSAQTEKLPGGLERIPADAPPEVHARLQRCRDVYAEAVAAIDPEQDAGLEEAAAWNLAGIINDYGLIVHYFLDVQDGPLAERLYLRALRMTNHGFKDTYVNLQHLYGHVLDGPEHLWRWYRLAREARDSILTESTDEAGQLALVPDEEKRQAAAQDMLAIRARILQVLAFDAGEDGLPWPPAKENGNDR
ncbi:MAG: hypothetical protein O2894_08340 [Planctomycetota bacterium]|nr:hypothetical protein [Planctomycetota bacterium]